MKVETSNLVTVKTFATNHKVTTAYIYKLMKEQKIQAVVIDDVYFIDVTKYPAIPGR